MTHYEVLGVPRDASAAQIKAAYRRLASSNHPDRQDGSGQERMAAINAAYDVLGDAEKRAHYDATGSDKPLHSVHEIAERTLIDMLNQILEADNDVVGDVVARLRETVSDAKRQTLLKQGTTKHKLERLDRRAKRIRGPLMAGLIASKRGTLEQELAQLAQVLLVNDAVTKLLDGYVDTAPAPPQQSYIQTLYLGGTSSGMGGWQR